MNADLTLFLKGAAMGAANVVPGVSGGTVALVTGIYRRLIDALGSVGPDSLKLLLARDLGGFWRAVDGRWLAVLLAGVAASVVSLAKLVEYLLGSHERATMAFFFGLIAVSVWYVAKRVERWGPSALAALAAGTAVAVAIATLAPGTENDAPWYVFVCGTLAITSMILPGLSGSFVLILTGNYALVLGAVSGFDLGVLVPLGLGCAVGLVAFARLLGWVFEHHADATLAAMTGFVVGSLVVIWPWKVASVETIERANGSAKEVVTGYSWFLPEASAETAVAAGLALAGAALIVALERVAGD